MKWIGPNVETADNQPLPSLQAADKHFDQLVSRCYTLVKLAAAFLSCCLQTFSACCPAAREPALAQSPPTSATVHAAKH